MQPSPENVYKDAAKKLEVVRKQMQHAEKTKEQALGDLITS